MVNKSDQIAYSSGTSSFSSQGVPTIGIIDSMGVYESINENKEFFSSQAQRRVIGSRNFISGEVKGIPVVMTSSGWGKVAAAAASALLLSHYSVDLLVLVGLCGSLKPYIEIGDLVIGTQYVHQDLDARPLFDRFEIPLLGVSFFSSHQPSRLAISQAADRFIDTFGKDIRNKLRGKEGDILKKHEGLIATRDQFLDSEEQAIKVSKELPHALVIDMEGAACAQIAYEYKVPFVGVKIVSDSADHVAALDFHEFVRSGARLYSQGLLSSIIDMIKEKTPLCSPI